MTRRVLKTTVVAMLARPAALRTAWLRMAAARGHTLVLAYHGVAPESGRNHILPPLDPALFVDHMRALKTVGDIVPLDTLLTRRSTARRPAFAVTFDDDDPQYVPHLLPILRDLQIPATFFLSGRSLHGLGPYWWTLVDRSVEEIGLADTAERLGCPARSLSELAHTCRARATVTELPVRVPPAVMPPADIRTLVDAGMSIGFHTLRHQLLPALDDAQLERAMAEGRDALASFLGRPIDVLAYPYGIVDARVARAAARAGYRAAFTAEWRAITQRSDPFHLARWQPDEIPGRQLIAEAALRVNVASAVRQAVA